METEYESQKLLAKAGAATEILGAFIYPLGKIPADLLDRLAMLYEETGRAEEAAVLRQEIQQTPDSKRTATVTRESDCMRIKETFDFGEHGLPLDQLPNLAKSLNSAPATAEERSGRQSRVGRNEPCPCGSGKKHKKCCGRPDASSP